MSQDTAAVLSEARQMCGCKTMPGVEAIVLPRIRAASSKSFIVNEPLGLSAVTREACTKGEKGACHKRCCCCRSSGCGARQKPPIPDFEASVAPRKCGACGTTVYSGTGCIAAMFSKCNQSWRIQQRRGVRYIRHPGTSYNAFCNNENK